jgi:hypothetical protein
MENKMTDIFKWLEKLPPHTIIAIVIILVIVLLIKFKDIIDFIKWTTKKGTIRTCGDCILIMFGIREKYETESYKIRHNVLRSQMSYFEQKSQEIVLWLTQSFQDDLEKLGSSKPGEMKTAQFGYYQEALKCAMMSVKDEVRRSFKENGFAEFSENEFSNYVKSKLRTLISIAKSYLSTYYIQGSDTIVTLKYRYEKLDYNRLNDIMFDVFGYARDALKEAEAKEKEIKEKFKNEIDLFVEKNKN